MIASTSYPLGHLKSKQKIDKIMKEQQSNESANEDKNTVEEEQKEEISPMEKTEKQFGDPAYFLKRQMMWLSLGIITFIFASKIDYKIYRKWKGSIYLGGLFLLVLVLIIGKESNGAKRWIGIGSFTIQPSEFAKITLIMMLAGLMTNYSLKLKKYKREKIEWKFIFKVIIIIGIYAMLVYLEKSFSSTLQIALIGLGMLFLSGISLKKFFSLIALIGGLSSIAILGTEYRMKRILAYLGGGGEDSKRQIEQALIAVGRGGFWGQSYGKGLQRNFWLPEIHTDYIFAAVGEEMGFWGSILLILLYIGLLVTILMVVKHCELKYGKYLLVGIFIMLSIQITGNMLVVLGRIPSTGITLPLFSYGGSSILSVMYALGIVYNVIKSIYAEEENE